MSGRSIASTGLNHSRPVRPLPFAVFSAVIVLAGCTNKPKIPVAAPMGKWVSLFNGRDLSGWTAKIAGQEAGDNYRGTFRVEKGLLEVSYRQYDRFGDRFGSLFYDTPYSHYWLRAQYRFVGDLAPGAPSWAYRNSGIQLHSQAPASMRKNQQFPVSVEFDLVGGRLLGNHPTGEVCHYGTRVSIAGAPVKELCSKVSDVTVRGSNWVTVLAEVDGGKRVRQAVNGFLVVEYTDLALDEGNADARRLLASGVAGPLTSGLISIQSNGAPIEFKRIELLPLDQPAVAAAAGASAGVNRPAGHYEAVKPTSSM